MSDASLQAQHRCIDAGLAGRPDFGESRGQRLRLLGLKDPERRTRLLEMKPVQIMLAVDDQQGGSVATLPSAPVWRIAMAWP
jgi:hypothetical protein